MEFTALEASKPVVLKSEEEIAIEEKKIEIPQVIETPKVETEEVKLRENKLWLHRHIARSKKYHWN